MRHLYVLAMLAACGGSDPNPSDGGGTRPTDTDTGPNPPPITDTDVTPPADTDAATPVDTDPPDTDVASPGDTDLADTDLGPPPPPDTGLDTDWAPVPPPPPLDPTTCNPDWELWDAAVPAGAGATFIGYPDSHTAWRTHPTLDGVGVFNLTSDRYATLDDDGVLSAGQNFTVNLWVRVPSQGSADGTILRVRPDSSSIEGFEIARSGGGFTVSYGQTGTTTFFTLSTGAGAVRPGEWQMLTFTGEIVPSFPSGVSYRRLLFVDGVQAVGSSNGLPMALPAGTPAQLGASGGASGSVRIGQLTVWNTPSNTNQIRSLFNLDSDVFNRRSLPGFLGTTTAPALALYPRDCDGPPLNDTSTPIDTDVDPVDTDTDVDPVDTDTDPPDTDTDVEPVDTDPADTDSDLPPGFGETCAPDGAVWEPQRPDASTTSFSGFPADPNEIWSTHPISGRAALQLAPDRYVDLPALSAFYQRNFAVEMWVKANGNGHLFSVRGDASQFSGSNITINGGTISGFVASGPSTWRSMSAPGAFTQGAWQHVVLTATESSGGGAGFALYVNGVQATSVGATALHFGAGAVPRIGLTDAQSATAAIGELRTYAVSLTADQVRARYNSRAADYGQTPGAPAPIVTELPALTLDPRLCDGEPAPPPEGATLFDADTCLAHPEVWPTASPNLTRAVRTGALASPMWEGLPFVGRGVIAMQPGEALDVELATSLLGASHKTYGAWVRLPTDFDASDEGVIFQTRTASDLLSLEVGVSAAQGYYVQIGDNDATLIYRTAAAGTVHLTPGSWQHVAVRITNNSDIRLFVNGGNWASASVLNAIHPGDVSLSLGSSIDDAFRGELGAFHAWPSAIPNGEIASLAGTLLDMPANLPPPAIDLRPADCEDVLDVCSLSPPDFALPEAGSAANDAVPFSSTDTLEWRDAPGLGQVARLVPMALPELSPGSLVDGPATVALWVRADVDATEGTLVTTRDATLGDAGIELRVNSAGNFEIVSDHPDMFSFTTAPTTVPLRRGEWQHVVLSFQRQTLLGDFYPLNVYIDGVEALDINDPALIRPDAVLTLGAPPVHSSPTLGAHIGAVRVYNGRLFSSQAQALFENERSQYGGPAPTVAPPSNVPLFSYLPQACEGP